MPTATVDDTTRLRDFLALAAAAATAAMARPALASPDDGALLVLEDLIFREWGQARSLNDEINRLGEVCRVESERLRDEVYAGRSILTADDRWAQVAAMPECNELARLTKQQGEFYARMNDFIAKMFAMPAHTEDGRRAKVTVLLSCVLGSRWSRVDEDTDYAELLTRNLLIEFIGGEPGAMLRDQFV